MENHIEIIPFNDLLAPNFAALNKAWVQKYFELEPLDEMMFANPRRYIIDAGGFIFFATIDHVVAGTFAFIKVSDTIFELSKMAVAESFQGKNIGNKMLAFCIAEAKRRKLKKIILHSNTILTPAIHLYKKYGFVEVLNFKSNYKRANIKMEIILNTMNRIDVLFAHKKKDVLNVYCTAGYPKLNSTLEVLTALQTYGADLIEIGMPYSDPLADGPIIQQSNMVALQNGMSINALFEQLKNVRETVTLPIILMGYMNPILQYGLEKFCAEAEQVGVDGIILPDLPMYEFETTYQQLFEKHNLKFIFLVTPETGEERIREIDNLSTGFLYAVSSSSTTGNNKAIEDQSAYFKKLRAMNLRNPILVGFGIKDKATFKVAGTYTNGAIIGSAYIKAIAHCEDINLGTKQFLNSILS